VLESALNSIVNSGVLGTSSGTYLGVNLELISGANLVAYLVDSSTYSEVNLELVSGTNSVVNSD
jgi:hypothetical protein